MSRLYTLLDSDHVSIAHVITDAQSFISNIIVYSDTETSLTSEPLTVSVVPPSMRLGTEWEKDLDQALRTCIEPGSAVLTLFTSRVYKLLARALTNTSFADKLATFSMNSPPQVSTHFIIK